MRYRFLRFPEGKPKAVTLSYDDGSRHDLRFSDTISEYGLKCTFNLNGDEMRGERSLPKETVIEKFLDRGHEVAVHGCFHRALGSVRPIEGIRDVLDCRLELESKYGRIIRGMAYPDCGITRFNNGASYDNIKNYLTDLGIVYCRTLGGDNRKFEFPTDWYSWMPTAHHNNPKLMEYIDEFMAIDTSEKTYCAARHPRLFYLWGHSHEFERDGKWELLDEICKKLSGHDEVWYATNIEIYDYVKAYESLVYSADGKMIYNPTLLKIWFDVDGKLYTIESGETVTL